jgi:nicotinamide mononucleotide transporter
MWPWEAVAVVSLIAYLILAIYENRACWLAAVIGTSIYVVLMYQVGLYMESLLQVFYLGMAIYGWYSWSHGPEPDHSLLVTDWPLAFNLLPVTLITCLSMLSGFVLSGYTDAALPYVDSFTTWGGIITTWMVAKKILQNWHYWFVIDAVSIYLYSSRGLWLTVLLFVIYLVLVIVGYRAWHKSMRTSDAGAVAST